MFGLNRAVWQVLDCRKALRLYSGLGKHSLRHGTVEAVSGFPRPATLGPWDFQTLGHSSTPGSLRRAENGGGDLLAGDSI